MISSLTPFSLLLLSLSHSYTHSEISSSLPDPVGRGEEGVDDGSLVEGAVESFTQPTRYDELLISTQVPCTPGATEVYYHDLHFVHIHIIHAVCIMYMLRVG